MRTDHIQQERLRPQACDLDLDGTLIDTLGDFVAVLGLVLSERP